MAEISTATQDNDPDDAAGQQYPSTVMNKYHCEITQELDGEDDDDHSGVVGSQRIEKIGTGPLPKESKYPPKNNHAHEESGTTTKYSRNAEKGLSSATKIAPRNGLRRRSPIPCKKRLVRSSNTLQNRITKNPEYFAVAPKRIS
jgi:hypothetical protein